VREGQHEVHSAIKAAFQISDSGFQTTPPVKTREHGSHNEKSSLREKNFEISSQGVFRKSVKTGLIRKNKLIRSKLSYFLIYAPNGIYGL